MFNLRFWFTAITAWLFLLYGLTRIQEPFQLITSTTLWLSFVFAMVAIWSPGYRSVGPLLAVSIAVPLMTRMLGLVESLEHPALAMVEIIVSAATVFLAHRTALCLREFEAGAVEMAAIHLDRQATDYEHGQRRFYQELRRAREFERPVTVLTLAPTEHSRQVMVNELVHEVQQRNIDKYAQLRLSSLLAEEVPDCATITQRNGVFMLLVPETDREQAGRLAAQLNKAASDELGVEFRIGSASFPEEEITLTGLLDRAETRMQERPAAEPADWPCHAELATQSNALENGPPRDNAWSAS